jgi:hypothetical protein
MKFEEEIEQINKLIANKRRIRSKLEDDIEQYHVKINRADQSVRIKKIEIIPINWILILDQTCSTIGTRCRCSSSP